MRTLIYLFSDLPTDEELSSLPQVQRNQIILTKFLGSGAFGEVFEGIVYGLNDVTPSLKIAIKVRIYFYQVSIKLHYIYYLKSLPCKISV